MSKTEENLQAAFAGESQARNMYTYWAAVARKEGYHYVAKIFEETADNVKRHAKDHFKRLGKINDTAANLKAAAAGEHYETTEMYPTFAEEAEAEGNEEVANLFRMIAMIEADHRDRFLKLLDMVEKGTVWEREEEITWKCSVCGYQHDGKTPPEVCPCCNHPKQYYEPADMSFGG